jgi:hypothetical protein
VDVVSMKVRDLLTGIAPVGLCDDCIAGHLGLNHRQQSSRATATFAGSAGFSRDRGECASCRKAKTISKYTVAATNLI